MITISLPQDKDDGKGENSEGKQVKKEDEEDTGEDKLWADVDKDLGDILAEAESGNKSSDEEDNGERYDRFNKLSNEKNGDDTTLNESAEIEGDDAKMEEVEEKE